MPVFLCTLAAKALVQWCVYLHLSSEISDIRVLPSITCSVGGLSLYYKPCTLNPKLYDKPYTLNPKLYYKPYTLTPELYY